jgi:hypothetical protein
MRDALAELVREYLADFWGRHVASPEWHFHKPYAALSSRTLADGSRFVQIDLFLASFHCPWLDAVRAVIDRNSARATGDRHQLNLPPILFPYAHPSNSHAHFAQFSLTTSLQLVAGTDSFIVLSPERSAGDHYGRRGRVGQGNTDVTTLFS